MRTASTLAGVLAVAAMTGCNGIFDSIYDPMPEAGAVADEGLSMTPSSPDRMTLTVDASDFGTWTYVSLSGMAMEKHAIPLACEGEWDGRSAIVYQAVEGDRYTALRTCATDPQPEPVEWDFAIHRFDVRTNGGAACRTSLTSLDGAGLLDLDSLEFTPDTWDATRVMVDLSDMMAYRIGYQAIATNAVLSEWVKMDISSPPPTFESTGLVYVMRLADGSACALQMRSYINARGEKGHLTIDIVYPL